MSKRKTTRRWSGAGDGLVHGYGIWPWGSDKTTRELLTFCGQNIGCDARGVWCRRPITCIVCLANQPASSVVGKIVLRLPLPAPIELNLTVCITED